MRLRSVAPLPFVLLLIVAAIAPAGAQSTFPAPPAPDLSAVTVAETDCAAYARPDFDPEAELGPIRCGTLSVPENWRRPEGRRVGIAFVVLKSRGERPAPDPLVYLSGGPGGSALMALEFYGRLFAPFRTERDVLLFDQRGTAYSDPLRCANWTVDDLFGLSLGKQAPAEAESPPTPGAGRLDPETILDGARDEVADDYARCAQQLLTQGIDLRQYTSIAGANYTVALVKALGYATYNLYGISYGTRLALVVMRDHPASGLRSVVLDSSFPPEMKGFEQYPAEPHEVVIQLFADCALDPACNAAYPNLKARFVALLDRLEREPIARPDGAEVTAGDVVQLMQGLSAQVAAVPYVPRMIAELERGETATYAGLVDGSLLAPPDDGPAPRPGADEEAAPTESPSPGEETSDPRVALADLLPGGGVGDATGLSPAEQFLGALQLRIAALPYQEGQDLALRVFYLGKLSPTRAILEAFVERAFPGPERADDRDALLALVAGMREADVTELFGILQKVSDNLDPSAVALNGLVFNSVECNEEIPFERFENTVATANRLEIPALGASTVPGIARQFAACEVWPSGRAPEIESRPVESDLPTLIMAGAYDMQTPVSWNKTAFVNLPNAWYVPFPMSGHGTITYSDCAAAVALAFLHDPTTAPDASCAATLKPKWALP